jgi:hypothetical protein
MRITIQATTKDRKTIETTSPTVSVDLPFDYLTISEVMEFLIKPALLSYGYMNETIEGYFENNQ